MGGRGSMGRSSSATLSGIKSRAQSWFDDVTKFDRQLDKKNNTDARVQGLKKSPTFMSHMREQIEKDAFDRNYEITVKQVDKIVSDIFEKAKRNKR